MTLTEKSYRDIADIYDVVELEGEGETRLTNARIMRHLRAASSLRVLDMGCGTGAQAIALHDAGFEVIASDLNESMLEVARRKSGDRALAFHQANMVDVDLGSFDAIIAINNAVGHLEAADFVRALRNASAHLADGGLLLFDVFNAPMMGYMPTRSVIDVAASHGDAKYVRYSSFAFDRGTGILTIEQTTHVQHKFQPYRTLGERYQLQAYDAAELERLVLGNGFSYASITADGMPELHAGVGLSNFVVCHK